jgi:integrase
VPSFDGFYDNLFKFIQRSVVSSTIPISEKLEISVDRRLKTSHGSYATILKRSGKSRDEIGEMMGHSTSQVTEHYLASLDMDKTWEINKGLL